MPDATLLCHARQDLFDVSLDAVDQFPFVCTQVGHPEFNGSLVLFRLLPVELASLVSIAAQLQCKF